MDYEKAYKILFNSITDAIIELDKISAVIFENWKAAEILKDAQQNTENLFIETSEEN